MYSCKINIITGLTFDYYLFILFTRIYCLSIHCLYTYCCYLTTRFSSPNSPSTPNIQSGDRKKSTHRHRWDSNRCHLVQRQVCYTYSKLGLFIYSCCHICQDSLWHSCCHSCCHIYCHSCCPMVWYTLECPRSCFIKISSTK